MSKDIKERNLGNISYFGDVVEKAIQYTVQYTAKDIIEIIEELKKFNQGTNRYIADEFADLVIDEIKERYGIKDE